MLNDRRGSAWRLDSPDFHFRPSERDTLNVLRCYRTVHLSLSLSLGRSTLRANVHAFAL